MARRVDGLFDQFAGRESAGKCRGLECGPTHFDGDGTRIPMPGPHATSIVTKPPLVSTVNMLPFRLAGRVKVAGKDAQAVAGFFCFAAVRVEDSRPKSAFFDGHTQESRRCPAPSCDRRWF